jgi:hypothetical protein
MRHEEDRESEDEHTEQCDRVPHSGRIMEEEDAKNEEEQKQLNDQVQVIQIQIQPEDFLVSSKSSSKISPKAS